MGRFFFGFVFGFFFSSAFYVVLLLARTSPNWRWLQRLGRLGAQFALEFVIVIGFFLLFLLVIGKFWPPESAWLSQWSVPAEGIRIVLGIAAGVLARVWLTAFLTQLPVLPQEPGDKPLAAAALEGERVEAEDLDASRESATPKEGAKSRKDTQTSSARDDLRWAALFIGIVAMALLLPYLDDLVRQATGVKLGFFEVQLRVEQQAGRTSALDRARDKTEAQFINPTKVKVVKQRLASDARRHESLKDANTAYGELYESTLYPVMQCVSDLTEAGWDMTAIKDETRKVAIEWYSVIRALESDKKLALQRLKSLVTAIDNARNTWADRDSKCKKAGKGSAAAANPLALQSPEFYLALAHVLNFLDDRLGAIHLLESAEKIFRDDNDINRGHYLALWYMDEDPTLAKASFYADKALRVLEQNLERLGEKMPSKLKCSDPADTSDLCADFNRYNGALPSRKNQVAYTYAQSGNRDVERARLLAREAVKAIRQGKDDSTNPKVWGYIDTYAYVAMAAAARAVETDTKAIACAQRVFDGLATLAQKKLSAALEEAEKPGFRLKAAGARSEMEIYRSHELLAASLLVKAGQGSCSNEEFQKMWKTEN